MSEGKGRFIVIDGVDGAGKSTQAYLLCRYLGSRKLRAVPTREPGGTEIGERIREILLDTTTDGLAAECELLLYMASRAQLVAQVIKPTLAEGNVVVSERYILSSLAYQGYAEGLSVGAIMCVADIATERIMPDLTVILDVDPAIAMNRDKGPVPVPGAAPGDGFPYDRIEKKGVDFQKKVRAGFLELAKMDPEHIKVIDGSRSPREVHEEIKKLVDIVIG